MSGTSKYELLQMPQSVSVYRQRGMQRLHNCYNLQCSSCFKHAWLMHAKFNCRSWLLSAILQYFLISTDSRILVQHNLLLTWFPCPSHPPSVSMVTNYIPLAFFYRRSICLTSENYSLLPLSCYDCSKAINVLHK